MFQHGGWTGFCGPANFYSGVSQPDLTDLHQEINILQSRQFSASGIENFIDVVDSGNRNNAITAYNAVTSHLGSGDYCALSIANDAIGEDAHTVIPYATNQVGGRVRCSDEAGQCRWCEGTRLCFQPPNVKFRGTADIRLRN